MGLLVACASPVPRFPAAETDGATSTSSTGEPTVGSSSDSGVVGTSSDDGRSESTTDGGDTTSDSGTTTMLPADSTTGGPMAGEPYGPCPGGDSDCPMGQMCVQFGDMMGSEVASTCGDPCSTRQPCEPGPAMMADPICVEHAGGSTCVLGCDNDDGCPERMVCAMSVVGLVCVWPS